MPHIAHGSYYRRHGGAQRVLDSWHSRAVRSAVADGRRPVAGGRRKLWYRSAHGTRYRQRFGRSVRRCRCACVCRGPGRGRRTSTSAAVSSGSSSTRAAMVRRRATSAVRPAAPSRACRNRARAWGASSPSVGRLASRTWHVASRATPSRRCRDGAPRMTAPARRQRVRAGLGRRARDWYARGSHEAASRLVRGSGPAPLE